MAWDFDFEMLLYLGMITVGFFLAPMDSNPPYFLVIGIVLAAVGLGLVYRKVKKK
ncbi:MAG: LPXTG cell wall anchor domain-containing protein [Thaumarchaeota archaeon]|nr:LPXTG cell wall anchor domain-containing protein [Nitrososphaerota archaeon]MDE1867353.1 LPXTG cell wall anchor domain-containing protein [Nitrososphaerota archaeon]